MMSYDLSALMDRMVEMEKEAVASVTTKVDGVPYYPYEQEAFPYWTNQITRMTLAYLASDIVQYPFQITGTLVLDHYTAGYKGERLTGAYAYIAAVLDYFRDRPGLDTDADPIEEDFVFVGLEITDVIGPAAFANSGEGPIQVGIKFVFSLPVIDEQFR